MTSSPTAKEELTEALTLLNTTSMPDTIFVHFTESVQVNSERVHFDRIEDDRIDYVMIARLDDKKALVAYNFADGSSISVNYAILDYAAGVYTPMSVDELIDSCSRPQGPERMSIAQLAAIALRAGANRSMFHPNPAFHQ